MPKATVCGVGIHYQRMGQGPDIVIMHGLGGNVAFWHFRIARALMSTFRVTLYDLRGHGHSDMPSSGYTSADMANDLAGLLDYLGIEKAHLVGHSFGGTVALHYGALNPDRVSSLTLADTRVRALQPVQRPNEWPHWRLLKRQLRNCGVSITEDETEAGIRLLEEFAYARLRGIRSASNSQGPSFVPFGGWGGREAAMRWLRLLTTTTAKKDFKAAAGLTLDKIRRVHHPVLAIYGEYSPCLPSCQGLQENLLDCTTIIVPKAGHFHPMVRQGTFVKSLWEFLANLIR